MEDDILYHDLYLNVTAKNLHITPTFNLAGGVITPLLNVKIDNVILADILQ